MLFIYGSNLLGGFQAGCGAGIEHALKNRRLERLQNADIIVIVRRPSDAHMEPEILIEARLPVILQIFHLLHRIGQENEIGCRALARCGRSRFALDTHSELEAAFP
jgi:hypothetical protein